MPKNTLKRGFTMVELMLVVAIVGALAALAIYGVLRYVNAAKTSEAKLAIGAITRLAVMAYNENAQPQILPEASMGATYNNILCGNAIAVPSAVPHGTKYQPRVATGFDFDTGDQGNGWICLGFSTSQPIYYQYNYVVGNGYVGPPLGAPNPGTSGFEVSAQGDLNADGNLQIFTLSGVTTGPEVKIASRLFIYNEVD